MSAWAPGALSPRPGAAPLPRMLAAQTAAELKLVLRNGEQVLLSLVIPLALVVLLVTVPFISVEGAASGGERADFFVPGILALAVMSAAFTGQAIAVGFERQYGVLKRLGATALPRSVLLAAKTLAVLVVELLQVSLLCLVGLVLGWDPQGSPLAVLALVVVGTAAFSGLGLLLGGTMRGLTTLAAANLLWFVLLVLGGVLFPLSAFGPAEPVLQLTLVALVGLALGWDPQGGVGAALLLVALGTAAFSGLGLLLGGTLPGLTALAAANLLWLVLLVLGGVVFPVEEFGPAADVVRLLPTAALSSGLREVLADGSGVPVRDAAALTAWAVAGLGAATRFFRWE